MQACAFALDDPAEWASFSRALPSSRALESWIAIEGMYCPACSLNVEDALASCAGVQAVEVNGGTGTARVTWQPGEGRPSDWWKALQRAGYGASPAGDVFTSASRRRAQRMLLWRWLVAGFCMMQVMMYAVPAYIAGPGDITPDIESLLRWASWLMTLPVVAFSCWPFFQSAWRDLKHWRVGMDVPVALGLAIAFGASTTATFDMQSVIGGQVWFDSITMFVFFLLSGRLLESRLRDRTAGALEALARRLPDTIERRRDDGTYERVGVRRLVAGDVIRVLAGEVVPADGEVIEGIGALDESLLTGESKPVGRGEGDAVVAGSHNLSLAIVVRVTRCGEATRFAEIVALMERASLDKPRAAQVADRIATPFLIGVIAASAAAGAWWWSAGPAHALGVAIAVLIVTCPCALSLATPAAALAAAGALARRGILVRRLQSLEACAEIDTVVFDKTGTLTQPDLAVTAIRTREGVDAAHALALAGALAQSSLHPASRAVARAAGTSSLHLSNVREVAGRGLQSMHIKLGSAAFCGAPPTSSSMSEVHLADDDGWLATFELEEHMRSDAPAAVTALQRLKMDVQLLSGNRELAVERLAARTGIERAFAQQTPEDKLAHVVALQSQGRRVAMVGDGMNDGPVLARADVSIAMGHAVPLAQAKSDFIIPGAQLGAVPQLVQHARRTRRVMRENLAWAAAYNIVCVPLAALGWMPPWLAGLGMAASSLVVVLNASRLASFAKEI
jgi:P-type Cu2+ transporter